MLRKSNTQNNKLENVSGFTFCNNMVRHTCIENATKKKCELQEQEGEAMYTICCFVALGYPATFDANLTRMLHFT